MIGGATRGVALNGMLIQIYSTTISYIPVSVNA